MIKKDYYTETFVTRKLKTYIPKNFTVVEVKYFKISKPMVFLSIAKKYKLIKSIGFSGVNIYENLVK